MRKALDQLYDAAAWLGAAFMVALLVMVLLSILGREFGFHVRGTDAYAGYMMAGLRANVRPEIPPKRFAAMALRSTLRRLHWSAICSALASAFRASGSRRWVWMRSKYLFLIS